MDCRMLDMQETILLTQYKVDVKQGARSQRRRISTVAGGFAAKKGEPKNGWHMQASSMMLTLSERP